MYLKMIFGKNKKQTMRQPQFKFDPLPSELPEICLFHQRWVETFDTQLFGQLCIKYVLIYYKIDLIQFCHKYIVDPSQKNSFWAFKNGKCFFRPKKMKVSLGNIACHSNMHPCAQYEIISTNYSMNVAIRLIIWLESLESSHMIALFLEHFLKIIDVLQVYYLYW